MKLAVFTYQGPFDLCRDITLAGVAQEFRQPKISNFRV